MNTNFFNTRNIFVAFDFLQYATQALNKAIDFAKITNAQITLYNAIEKTPQVFQELLYPYAAMGADEIELLAEIRENRQKRASSFIADHYKKTSVELKILVSFAKDSLAKSILHSASEDNADLIFAGSYGTKPHTTGIIGGIASALIAHSPIPIYLIKDPYGTALPKNVLVVLNSPEFSPSLLEWAASFVVLHEDTDLHVITPIADLPAYDTPNDYNLTLTQKQIDTATASATKRAKIAVQALELPFKYEKRGKQLSFTHHKPIGIPTKTIIQTADQINADLIIIPTSPPNLDNYNPRRDLARTISEYAHQNVLFIPESHLKNVFQTLDDPA